MASPKPTSMKTSPIPTGDASIAPTIRDPRLDFYRGLAMFIIFISHMPNNWVGNWIPGRFGFSDATEIFVFCSGMASAVAFGRSYDRNGWLIGTARVSYRIWQIYWAHICLFLATAMMLAAIDAAGPFDKTYVNSWNLTRFFTETPQQLLGLFTLTYVPNFFDILPMYMILLLMMPLIMALSNLSLWLVAAVCLAFWALGQLQLMHVLGLGRFAINFPAEPWSDRPWFFNPFGWQAVFFTGFAFMRGWLPKPPVNKSLISLAVVIVIGSVFISSVAIREFGMTWVSQWRSDNAMWITKTNFGLVRFVHFLALAYLAWVLAGDGGKRLIVKGSSAMAGTTRRIIALITKVGQQSLAVFMVSIVLSSFGGFVLDMIGNEVGPVVLINLSGCALLIVTAYSASWFKSQPWKRSATG